MPKFSPSRLPSDRFVLAPGETILASAEVIADTPSMAKAWRMLYVTNRRVVLGAARYWPFFLLEAALAAGLILSLNAGDSVHAGVMGRITFFGIILSVVLRPKFKRRRLAAEAPIRDVETFARSGNAVVLGLSDGGTWWLAPSRILFVIWSPVSSSAIQTAAREIQHALGLPVARKRKRAAWFARRSPIKPAMKQKP